jgi:hypothetical protein
MKANGRKSRDLVRSESRSLAEARRVDGENFSRRQRETEVAPEITLNSGEGDRQCEAMDSSCCGSKGRALEVARPLRLQCSDCEVLLHELSNVVTGVLMNAQMLEWKLPPYSHLKRSVREMERNAQRGGELLKRLMRRLAPGEANSESPDVTTAASDASPARVSREVTGKRMGAISADLTLDCDPCTSGVFPKRDDGKEC